MSPSRWNWWHQAATFPALILCHTSVPGAKIFLYHGDLKLLWLVLLFAALQCLEKRNRKCSNSIPKHSLSVEVPLPHHTSRLKVGVPFFKAYSLIFESGIRNLDWKVWNDLHIDKHKWDIADGSGVKGMFCNKSVHFTPLPCGTLAPCTRLLQITTYSYIESPIGVSLF